MVFTNEAAWTGGPDGMPVPRLVLFGWRVFGPWTWYWIAGVTLVIGTWIAVNLIASPTGRALRAIHDSETAVARARRRRRALQAHRLRHLGGLRGRRRRLSRDCSTGW